ncbi:hypothetical protein V9T40_001765 [Parthenolecanium corni]|uniref:Uncharacterized protein n=1 Tax=Parthenolecanium corni TaxID=536013 RepID=A0AAN9TF36_9HEMI
MCVSINNLNVLAMCVSSLHSNYKQNRLTWNPWKLNVVKRDLSSCVRSGTKFSHASSIYTQSPRPVVNATSPHQSPYTLMLEIDRCRRNVRSINLVAIRLDLDQEIRDVEMSTTSSISTSSITSFHRRNVSLNLRQVLGLPHEMAEGGGEQIDGRALRQVKGRKFVPETKRADGGSSFDQFSSRSPVINENTTTVTVEADAAFYVHARRLLNPEIVSHRVTERR